MAVELLRAHDAIIWRCLEHHCGSEVKHLGDGIMASFVDVPASVACAIEIQEEPGGETALLGERLHRELQCPPPPSSVLSTWGTAGVLSPYSAGRGSSRLDGTGQRRNKFGTHFISGDASYHSITSSARSGNAGGMF